MNLFRVSAAAGDFMVHAAGCWDERQLAVENVASTWSATEHTLAKIDESWRQIAARGVRLFDGPMCRFEGCIATLELVTLRLSRTSYKPFLGTNLSFPELADEAGWGALANPVGVSAIVLSADGSLVLGRRNDSVAYYPGRIHPFAGALEPRDGCAPFTAVRRELSEEVRLGPDQQTGLRCIGLVEDLRLRQPELIFMVESRLTREELRAGLDLEEHGSIEVIAATGEAVAASRGDAALTPVGVASCLLWGRIRWGDDWLREACAG